MDRSRSSARPEKLVTQVWDLNRKLSPLRLELWRTTENLIFTVQQHVIRHQRLSIDFLHHTTVPMQINDGSGSRPDLPRLVEEKLLLSLLQLCLHGHDPRLDCEAL